MSEPQVAWVHGYPCSGKTFNADYLETIGWVNIDGDSLMSSTDQADIDLWKKVGAVFYKWTSFVELTEEDHVTWKKHYGILCDKALKVVSEGKSACISFVAYKPYVRDYIRERIPDVKIIHIQVDTHLLIPKNQARMERACAASGTSFEQFWQMPGPEMAKARADFGAEFTMDGFNKWMEVTYYQGFDLHTEHEKEYCHTVHNSEYGKAGIQQLRDILGIEGEFNYDAKAIEDVQTARYAKMNLKAYFVEEKERSFIMIKPDGVQRGLIGKIVERFEQKGFKLVAMKICAPGKEHMEKHYADLSKKGFFAGLVEYMSSGPVCAMVWEGDNVVATGRKMLGATKPADSEPGTIRGDFCIDVGRNICHGSDAVESAKEEIKLWFKDEELSTYTHHSKEQIYE